MNSRFIEIYENDEWGHGSGEGSLEMHTKGYVAFLQSFLRRKRIASVVDMGCGDWQFSRSIDWGGIDYRGFDVVPSLIAANAGRYGGGNVSFGLYSGDPAELPAADLLIAKDILQHLPYAQIRSVLACLGKYRYALLTNCIAPRGRTKNTDIATGGFRYLDLRREPFNLPAKQVYAFAKKMNRIRRFLRGPDWRKAVLLVERKP